MLALQRFVVSLSPDSRQSTHPAASVQPFARSLEWSRPVARGCGFSRGRRADPLSAARSPVPVQSAKCEYQSVYWHGYSNAKFVRTLLSETRALGAGWTSTGVGAGDGAQVFEGGATGVRGSVKEGGGFTALTGPELKLRVGWTVDG